MLLPLPDSRHVRFVRVVLGEEGKKRAPQKSLGQAKGLRPAAPRSKLVREMPYGPSEGTSPSTGPRRQSKPCKFSHSRLILFDGPRFAAPWPIGSARLFRAGRKGKHSGKKSLLRRKGPCQPSLQISGGRLPSARSGFDSPRPSSRSPGGARSRCRTRGRGSGIRLHRSCTPASTCMRALVANGPVHSRSRPPAVDERELLRLTEVDIGVVLAVLVAERDRIAGGPQMDIGSRPSPAPASGPWACSAAGLVARRRRPGPSARRRARPARSRRSRGTSSSHRCRSSCRNRPSPARARPPRPRRSCRRRSARSARRS